MTDTATDTHSNHSCNGYKLSPIETDILDTINESAIELFPKQIAEQLGKKLGTIRPYLRRMLIKGVIFQPYKGTYCNRITYDVRFVPLLVHNLRLCFQVVGDVVSWVFDEVVGGVGLHVCFGSERHKVSGWLKCDRGMNRDTCFLALYRWIDVVEKRLGYEIPELFVSTLEANRDYAGTRLDGDFHAISKRMFLDTIERIYQKEENVVRSEAKISRPMTLTQVEEIFNKGSTGFLVAEQNLDNRRSLEDLRNAMKFMNQRELEIQRTVDALAKAFIDLKEVLVNQDKGSGVGSKPLGKSDYSV